MMLIVMLVAAFSVPVIAQQSPSVSSKEGAKGVTKTTATRPPQSSEQQQLNKQEKKGPTSQADRQKAQKERAKTIKELDKAVRKTDSDINRNRSKTSIHIEKGVQTMILGEGQ